MLSGINGFLLVKGRNIRKVMGEGGARGRAKYKKIYSCKGKLNEKNSCTPIKPKNIHATA